METGVPSRREVPGFLEARAAHLGPRPKALDPQNSFAPSRSLSLWRETVSTFAAPLVPEPTCHIVLIRTALAAFHLFPYTVCLPSQNRESRQLGFTF